MENSIVSLQVIWALNVGSKGVQRNDLETKFKAANLTIPRRPKTTALLTRACQRIATGRKWLGMKRIGGGVGFISHDIAASEKKFNPVHFATACIYGEELEIISITDPSGWSVLEKEMIEWLKTEFAISADFANASDLRTILQRAITGSSKEPGMAGVPVVGNGVQAYFVPAKFRDDVVSLGLILEELSPSSRFDIFALGDHDGNLQAVRKHAKHQHLMELGDLRESIKELIADGDAASQRSINAKMEYIQKLNTKVDLWQDVLGDIAQEISAGIDGVKRDLMQELRLDEQANHQGISGAARQVWEAYIDGRDDAFSHDDILEQMETGSVKYVVGYVRQILKELYVAGKLAKSGELPAGFYTVK